jgi:predicted nucleic acid-binding protein
MTHGFDTGFLVAFDVAAHASHQGARARLDECHLNGDDFALAPQVLAEFVHVVAGITSVMTTDTRGFQVFDRFQIVRL